MKVTVNKCPHTGKLFEDDKAYRRHMRDIQLFLRDDRERFEFSQNFDEFIAPMYQVYTGEELEVWLNANFGMIAWHYGYRNRWWTKNEYKRMKPGPEDTFEFSLNIRKFGDVKTSPNWHKTAPKGHFLTKGHPYSYSYDYTEEGWLGNISVKFGGKAYDFLTLLNLKV